MCYSDREKNLEYHKQYYIKNREKLLDYMKTPMYCDLCQCHFHKTSKTKHFDSKKHTNNNLAYLENLGKIK